jgi:hypothetical protein
MSNQTEIIALVDQVGRIVVGVETDQTDDTITLNNPVIVHVQPDPQNGQLQVQTFPYLFMEFIKGDKTLNEWTFNKSAITTSNVKLTDQITAQYHAINNPAPAPAPVDPDVIKLFDADAKEVD